MCALCDVNGPMGCFLQVIYLAIFCIICVIFCLTVTIRNLVNCKYHAFQKKIIYVERSIKKGDKFIGIKIY